MKLLLHVCCAPCLLGCMDELNKKYEVSCYFYNPNIISKSEFDKRLSAVKIVLETNYPANKLIVEEYSHEEFVSSITGLEREKEGGVRCENCIELRCQKTAKFSKANDYDCFDSTLSVSPHKNYNYIKSIGERLGHRYNIKYLGNDFKKNDGFLKSTKLAKQLGIYRQNFCGCEFSTAPQAVTEEKNGR